MRVYASASSSVRTSQSLQRPVWVLGILLIILIVTGLPSNSQNFSAFPCDGTIYYSINIGTNFTQLAILNHETRSFEYIGSELPRYNGIGISPNDGLMYATVPATGEIYRIDAVGNFTSIGLPTGAFPSDGGWVSAGFLPDGRFVMNQANNGDIVVLEGLEQSRIEVVSIASYGQGNYIDVAYNPADGLLYTYEKSHQFKLTTIDPYTGETTFMGVSNEDLSPGTGGMAFDASGNLLSVGGAGNSSSDLADSNFKIFQFDIDPESANFGRSHVFMETTHEAGGVDATSCNF